MNDNKIQIIKDDEIDLRALFQVLWNNRISVNENKHTGLIMVSTLMD